MIISDSGRVVRACKKVLEGAISAIVCDPNDNDTLFLGGIQSPILVQMDMNEFNQISVNNGVRAYYKSIGANAK